MILFVPNQKLSGPWSQSDCNEYLQQSVIPIKLSAVSSDGWPTIASLWFIHENGILSCVTKKKARITQLLRNDPRCGFEISCEAPPYCGIRGRGTVELSEHLGPCLLPRLVDRYIGVEETKFRRWLLSRNDEEIAIMISPISLMSWDYRKRMST